jgi:hypothetical protein
MDCEPKKREMYEMATDTKERMSRSLETLNIGKSAISTQSTEILDVDMGQSFSHSGQGSFLGTGGGGSFSFSNQGQWGTKQVSNNESGIVRTTDNSQERRETHSFTTQISQLYHLLDCYHLGTNRVVLFMQPRPHVLEEPSGFVRGPRPIEGIQEFFLVVAKPKDQGDFCVSVRLDTAHLALRDVMDYETRLDKIELSVSASPPGREDPQAEFDGYEYIDIIAIKKDRRYSCFRKRVEDVENYIPPYSDYRIDVANEGGYQITSSSNSYGAYAVDVQSGGDSLTARVWATARKCYDDGPPPACVNCPSTKSSRSAFSNLSMIVHLKSKEPVPTGRQELVLLVTTRGLCCCPRTPTRPDDFELPGVRTATPLYNLVRKKGAQFGLNVNFAERLTMTADATETQESREEVNGRMRVEESNALTSLIRAELTATVAPGATQRKPPIPYIRTDFFLEKLEARLRPYEKIRNQGDQPVGHLFEQAIRCNRMEISQLEELFHKPIAEIKNRDLARLSVSELAKATGLALNEAAIIRLRSLGIPTREQPDTVS